MTDIRIAYDMRIIKERQIASQIAGRFLGPGRRVLLPLAVIVPYVVGAALLHNFTSLNMLRTEVMVSILLFYVGIGVWIFTVSYLGRLIDAEANTAPFRNRELHWILSEDGITVEGVLRPWSWILDVQRIKHNTVLLLSVRNFIVLPDVGLPAGLTPDALQAQIADWRT